MTALEILGVIWLASVALVAVAIVGSAIAARLRDRATARRAARQIDIEWEEVNRWHSWPAS